MIPHYLEKAILSGWATYSKVSHAFGMFGQIHLPKDSTVIITDLKFFPFLNPIKRWEELQQMTWRQWFKYNEYQLKLDGKKSINYLQFRNQFDYKFTFSNQDSFSFKLDEPINQDYFYNYLLPIQKQPIQQDVYFVCEDYIRLTISRNALAQIVTNDFTVMNEHADQKPAPNGVKNTLVSNKLNLQSPSGTNMDYVPVLNFNAANPSTILRNTEPYFQDLDNDDSRIQDPQDSQTQNRCDFPYHTNPLIEFGIVTIKNVYLKSLIQNT